MDFQQVDSGFPFLAGSWIPKAGFWIPEPSIPDSTSKNFLDSGIRITLPFCTFHGRYQVNFAGLLVRLKIEQRKYTRKFLQQLYNHPLFF